MKYTISATSAPETPGHIDIKETHISFGTAANSSQLANPAEVFLSAFAACMLKNVARFSEMMPFQYYKATVEVTATREEKPPRIDQLTYALTIQSKDTGLNPMLLKKNIEKFGTIYNTMAKSCRIEGNIQVIE
ncbi:MAG: OsmC family protein [Flavobacteriaceae bacterium]